MQSIEGSVLGVGKDVLVTIGLIGGGDDDMRNGTAPPPAIRVGGREPGPTPAGRSRPVWGVFGTAARCIDPEIHRFSYKRMGATVAEVEGASHVVMISHPKEVADVVRTAVEACVVTPA